MNKLMLLRGRAMACLIFMYLFLAQGCRKEHFPFYDPGSSIAKVNDQAIDNWYKENPVSQIIGIDWSKARQATIDGKHLVRVPTLNIDKIKSVLGAKSMLKQGLLSSNGKIAAVKGRVGVEENPVIDEGGNGSGNTNYYSAHPPEVYFIQDPLTSKLHTYLINFIPDNEAAGFGQGGNWTGKLYEWDTKSDTVLVQTFVNNVLTDRSVRVFYHVDENGGIALTKPQKLQSLTPIKDKQVSGIFGWLLDKILDGLGAIGSIFGLTELVPSTSSSTGHHYHYRFISHPSSPGTDWVDIGNPGSQFLSLGLPLVSSYLTGMDTGIPHVEVTYNTYDYDGINHTKGGPNNTLPNENGIYVLEYLTVSPAAQEYILSIPAAPLAEVLRTYLDSNGKTEENKAFASWGCEYIYANPQAFNQAFVDLFTGIYNEYSPVYIPKDFDIQYDQQWYDDEDELGIIDVETVQQGLPNADPIPESYYIKGTGIDMTPATPRNGRTVHGNPRNAKYFWEQLIKKRPEMFSPENRGYIANNQFNKVNADDQWIKYNPTHKSYRFNQLVHHHHKQRNIAFAIPAKVHQKWTSRLHLTRLNLSKVKNRLNSLGPFMELFSIFTDIRTGNPDAWVNGFGATDEIGKLYKEPLQNFYFEIMQQQVFKNSSGTVTRAIVTYDAFEDYIWDEDERRYMGIFKIATYEEDIDVTNRRTNSLRKVN